MPKSGDLGQKPSVVLSAIYFALKLNNLEVTESVENYETKL